MTNSLDNVIALGRRVFLGRCGLGLCATALWRLLARDAAPIPL
jgi:hypothetical protein